MVLRHYRITIVQFAVERIFRISTLLAKLQAKWFDCFKCPVWSALSCLKVQILPNNLRMMDNSCYSLLLILEQSNSESNSESDLLSLKGWRFFETQCTSYSNYCVIWSCQPSWINNLLSDSDVRALFVHHSKLYISNN